MRQKNLVKIIGRAGGCLTCERLEQNTPGIVDAAVIGYYFDPNNLSSFGTIPFQVTVQESEYGLDSEYEPAGKLQRLGEEFQT